MEALYVIGAFILLVALIFATLNWQYRDRRKDKIAEQVVRDRYEHNQS
jgi:heme/copper-type cytochrome/quinol oxidase subunit 2